MDTSSDITNFDDVATVFADYGVSLRGFVRYKICQRNLAAYLPKRSLNVLDVGGGSGADTGWLASKGHQVTLLEPSAKQREYAQRRFNFFLEEPARKRITVIAGGLAEVPRSRKYDLVLLHGVAVYQANPAQFVAQAAAYAKRGGLISVMEKGYYGAAARLVATRDFIGLESLRVTQRAINHLQEEVHAFYPEELEKALQEQANAEILEWSGVRVLSDGLDIGVSELSHTELDQLIEAEYEQGHHPAIRGGGQMLHFIARKR